MTEFQAGFKNQTVFCNPIVLNPDKIEIDTNKLQISSDKTLIMLKPIEADLTISSFLVEDQEDGRFIIVMNQSPYRIWLKHNDLDITDELNRINNTATETDFPLDPGRTVFIIWADEDEHFKGWIIFNSSPIV